MTVTSVPVDVVRYAAQVRAALADLAPADRDELLEDLENHLLEVRSDDDGPLELRLGAPEAYAAELRASAGLAPARRSRWGLLGRVDDGLRRDVERLRAGVVALHGGREVADFLPELRPGWWVLRAWGAVWVLELLLDSYAELSAFPIPTVAGSAVLGLVAVLAATVFSVRIGRGHAPPVLCRPRVVATGNVVLVVLGLLLANNVQERFTVMSADAAYAGSPGVLTTADRRPVSNLYAFDSLGRPLRDVQLYDQDGRPLDTLALAAPDGSYAEPEYRLDEAGAPRGNVFPRRLATEVWTDTGPSPAPVPPPAVNAPRLATPEPSPSPEPSPEPSPS